MKYTLFSLNFESIKFREKSRAIFHDFERKVELECIKFRYFSILQYLHRGIPYALLCLACGFRGFDIQKEILEDN